MFAGFILVNSSHCNANSRNAPATLYWLFLNHIGPKSPSAFDMQDAGQFYALAEYGISNGTFAQTHDASDPIRGHDAAIDAVDPVASNESS